MVFSEAIDNARAACKVQIFASDVDTSAWAAAREGYYPDTTGVNKARLSRHFVPEGSGFRVKPELRAMVTFAQHDVLTDPPFAGLDLLSCRNVMIYLGPEAQDKLLESFHFALVPGGLLLLGSAETAGASDRRFLSVSGPARLYRNQTRPGAKAKGTSRPPAVPAGAPVPDPPQQFDRLSGLQPLATTLSPAAVPGTLAEALQELQLARAAQNAMREDALSVSEEYQAANEELLASKEELQSLNEELTALNSQLQETLETQRATSDDLQNVLYSTNVASLFLDADLQIRFFTPAMRSLFSLRPGDIGRPLAELAPLSTDRELLTDARAVLAGEPSVEQEIEAHAGTWFNRRVFPYMTSGGKIAGVVITYSDYTERRKVTEALAAAERTARLASDAKTRFLAVASHDLRQPLQTMVILQGLLATAVTGSRRRPCWPNGGNTRRDGADARCLARHEPDRGRRHPARKDAVPDQRNL
jgi:PAS domain-containing protein